MNCTKSWCIPVDAKPLIKPVSTISGVICHALIHADIITPNIVDIDDINIKATTEEKLGFTGSCEGIAAHAVVLIKKI